MNNPWIDAVSRAVAEGKTGFQAAVADGKYPGDMFFITDKNNAILTALCWSGERWMPWNVVWHIESDSIRAEVNPPAGFTKV